MIIKEQYNLVISDIISSLVNKQVPSDELLIKYFDLVESGGIGAKELWYSNIIKYMRNAVSTLNNLYTEEEVYVLIDQTLNKISELSVPFNIVFFRKYVLTMDLISDKELPHMEKISILEDMLNCGEIENCLYELPISNQLLGFYLTIASEYILKIKDLSDRIKVLMAERDKLPSDLNRP